MSEIIERVKSELEEHTMHGSCLSVYRKGDAEDMTDAGGVAIHGYIIDLADEHDEAELHNRVREALDYVFYDHGCGCAHDCCGHRFTFTSRVFLEKARNIYGDEWLKGREAYNFFAYYNYGFNY